MKLSQYFHKSINIERKEIDGETWMKFNREYDKFRYYLGNLLTVGLIIVLIIALILLFVKVLPYISLLKSNPCGLCENLGFMCSKMS